MPLLETLAEVIEDFHHTRRGSDNQPPAPVGSSMIGLIGMDLAVQDEIPGLGEARRRESHPAKEEGQGPRQKLHDVSFTGPSPPR
jgi:hypothetical protein